MRVDITAYAGTTIRLGFHFVSDESVSDIGWYIDDVAIEHHTRPYLSGAITSLNSLNFPYIYLNVAVWTNGVFAPDLDDPNFLIREDGVEQTRKKEVLKPSDGSGESGENGGQRLADIIFIMDTVEACLPRRQKLSATSSTSLMGLLRKASISR